MVSTICVGTVSAGAETPEFTVDGFDNGDGYYCVRIDGLTPSELTTASLWLSVPYYSIVVYLKVENGDEKYILGAFYVPLNGEMRYSAFIMPEEDNDKKEIISGRFYNNGNSGGYVFFIPMDNKYLEKILNCTTGEASITLQSTDGTRIWELDNELQTDKAVKISPKFEIADDNKSKDISSLTISKPANKTYTGKNRKAAVTIKDGNYTLKSGTDYTLTYKNCKNIGTASVTIKGKGKYTGSKTLTYKIVPKKTTLKAAKKSDTKVKLSWAAVNGAEKYQIYYSTNGGKYKKLTTVSGSKTSATLSKLDFEKNDYKFKIRSYKTVDGKKYYSSYSKAVTIK